MAAGREPAVLGVRDPVGRGLVVARRAAGGQQQPTGARVGGAVLQGRRAQGKHAPGTTDL